MLFSRILHFTDKQLIWECRKEIVFEDGHRNFHNDLFNVPSIVRRSSNPSTPHHRALPLWYTLLKTYSKCQLTVPSDKLPAISSLARFLSGALRSPYLAVIWAADIHIGLAWYRVSYSQWRSHCSLRTIPKILYRGSEQKPLEAGPNLW